MCAIIADPALQNSLTFKDTAKMRERKNNYRLPKRESQSSANSLWESLLRWRASLSIIHKLAWENEQEGGNTYTPRHVRAWGREMDTRSSGGRVCLEAGNNISIPRMLVAWLPAIFCRQEHENLSWQNKRRIIHSDSGKNTKTKRS